MKRIRLKEKEIREEILKIHPPEFYEKKTGTNGWRAKACMS
jgi:hypothetical protein